MAAEAHSHEHIHGEGHDHDHDPMLETDVAVRRSYVPVRLACLGIAVFFGFVGVIGLGRMGIDFTNVRDETTSVFGLGMTELLAMIFVGIAIFSLICAAVGPMARAWMMLLGPMMLAAGIVLMFRPDILGDWLATTWTTAVAFVVAGGIGVATVIGTPITWARRREVHRSGALTA